MSEHQIRKYDIVIGALNYLPLRRGDPILLVAEQYGTLRLWAETNTATRDPSAPDRIFATRPTGGSPPENGRHVGSVVMRDGGVNGELVWHVYEQLT